MEVERDGVKKKFWRVELTPKPAEPSILFANFDEEGLFLNDKALLMLKNISKPVAVLTICGQFRSGKSYYLSRVLGNESCFKSTPNSDPCTEGMWMATSALECDEFVVVLMDTEGTSSLEGPDRERKVTSFMVLSTLLSSLLIYNSKGVATQGILTEMS